MKKNCVYLFNSNQKLFNSKNNKIKAQFSKAHFSKNAKTQLIKADSFSDHNNHNVYITNEFNSDSEKSQK